jgi:ferredoxin, 2Fe-2S
MPFITFEPMRVRLPCETGESLLEVARKHGVPVDTTCVGQATCGRCRVTIKGGEDHLTPFNDAERKHLGNVYFLTKQRLACQARLTGTPEAELTVEVPPIKRRRT